MTIQHAKELRQGYREDVALHYANWAKMKQINSKYWNDFIIQCNLADYTLYEMAREWEYEKKWMQRVIELIQAEHDKHTHPTFKILQKTGTFRVQNPDNGKVFTICLRDWENVLFFVGVDEESSYQMNPSKIEDWLSRLGVVNE